METVILILREEYRSNSIFSCCWKTESGSRTLFSKKVMGNLNQNPATVSGFRICPQSTAVFQISDEFKSLPDDVVGSTVVHVDDETHPATVMLQIGIVKSLFFRITHGGIHSRRGFQGEFLHQLFQQNPFYFVILWISFTPAQGLMQGECLNRPTKNGTNGWG